MYKATTFLWCGILAGCFGYASAQALYTDIDTSDLHTSLSDSNYEQVIKEKTFPKARANPYNLDLTENKILNLEKDIIFIPVDEETDFYDFPINYHSYPEFYPTGDPMVREKINSKNVINVIKLLSPEQSKELICLSLNTYHEARSDTQKGQIATAFVVLNRVKHPSFPDNICDVVWQYYKKQSGGYIAQFSWTRDGTPDIPKNKQAWILAQKLAYLAYFSDIAKLPDITSGRLNYYAHDSIDPPPWARNVDGAIVIGAHTFLTAKEHLYIAQKEEKKEKYEN